jgi:hypothetical protein
MLVHIDQCHDCDWVTRDLSVASVEWLSQVRCQDWHWVHWHHQNYDWYEVDCYCQLHTLYQHCPWNPVPLVQHVEGEKLHMKTAALVNDYVLYVYHGYFSLPRSVGLNDWSLANIRIQVHRDRQDLYVQGIRMLRESKIIGSITKSHMHVNLSIILQSFDYV